MTLVAPSGRRITRAGADAGTDSGVTHRVHATFETHQVTQPEAGTWTVELFGANIAPQGEPTDLTVNQTPARNKLPAANVNVVQKGRTITVSTQGQHRLDGQMS